MTCRWRFGCRRKLSARARRKRTITRFLGTFLLIFTVGCNVMSGSAAWGGVSIACVLMVAIYSLAAISGANFNPAVSLALGITKARGGDGLEWREVGIYMGVQIFGGLAAAFCYFALFLNSFTLAPAQGFSAVQAGLCEALYTFMLCFVVLNVAIAPRTGNSPNQFYGLAIGFVIIAGAYGAGAVSGGCFNPAVAIGVDVAGSLVTGELGMCIVYVLCEFVGAGLAAVLFEVVRPAEFGKPQGSLCDVVSEFLGTYMLVLTVGLNVLGKSPAGAFSIAASLMCMIYALGNVSGANFNPAVTIAIFVSGRDELFSLVKVGKYIAAQILGGMLAALTYSVIRNGDSFALGPGVNFGWLEMVFGEMMFTFVLCYVVLSVAVSKTTNSATMFGLAIGSCVTVGGNAIGGISGGSLNPAVSFGIATGHMTSASFVAAVVYTISEVVGALAAVGVFAVTHKVDKADETKA